MSKGGYPYKLCRFILPGAAVSVLPGQDLMTDQRLSLLTAGKPPTLTTQKRAGADLRLTTRDYGAFELPMLPGASACAFRFCVAPVAKGLPVTASGAAWAVFLPLMFSNVYACKAFIYALSGRLLRMSTVLFASSGPVTRLASPAYFSLCSVVARGCHLLSPARHPLSALRRFAIVSCASRRSWLTHNR